MKKIIKGKVYDTDTAVRIGGFNDNPINTIDEDLYRKKTGEFFLKHWDAWNGSSIHPISYSEAQEWAEKHLDVDDYIQVFGEPEESGCQQVCISLDKAVIAKVKKDAGSSGLTVSEYISNLIKFAEIEADD